MEEVWKDIPGYEGRYQVSNQGRVRSLSRVVVQKNGRSRKVPERLLSAKGTGQGRYPLVSLWSDGAAWWVAVHYLVALSFIGVRPEGMEVLHGNGDPSDNKLSNLRYGTRKENVADAIKHGTHIKGEAQGAAKLTREDVLHIRNSNIPQKELAEVFNVSQSNISRIKNYRAWRHV